MPKPKSIVTGAVKALAGSALAARAMQLGIEQICSPQGRAIDVAGVRLHVVNCGTDHEGRSPMLMIHGLNGTSRNFTMHLTGQLERDARMHVVDRPGVGYSQPLPGDNSLAGQAKVMAALIEKMGLRRPLLVGHSLGGALSLRMALDYPDLISGAALITPATHPLFPKDQAARVRMMLASPLHKLVAETFGAPLSVPLSPFVMRKIFSPEPWPLSMWWAGGGLLALRPDSIAASGRDLRAAIDDLTHMHERYGNLSVPVHVLGAEGDTLVPPDLHVNLLAQQSPAVRLTLVPGGHMLPVTQPRLVATWLRDVLADVSGGR